jgi:hypothetical protein
MSASAVLTHGVGVGDTGVEGVQRLAVAWQHPVERRISPVGLLDYDGVTYRFRYLRRALETAGFRPFLGFPEWDREYISDRLFPMFAERVMSPRRPDYPTYLRTLDLPDDPSPMEVLARSEGRRVGDTVQLFPEPTVQPNGRTTCRFLVHGIRHMLRADPGVEDKLARLSVGGRLVLVDEPTNPYNPRAVLTSSVDGQRIGWVPDLLLDYVHTVLETGSVTVVAEHVNGPEAPFHLRVLARLDAQVQIGYRPFTGPEWETTVS